MVAKARERKWEYNEAIHQLQISRRPSGEKYCTIFSLNVVHL
jgi:hypothetical protein